MDIRKVIIFKRKSDADEIRKFIIADTLYYQVGLITDRRRETCRCSHTDNHKERRRTYASCDEMESAKGKASAAAALFVISSVNRLVMTNITASNTAGP